MAPSWCLRALVLIFILLTAILLLSAPVTEDYWDWEHNGPPAIELAKEMMNSEVHKNATPNPGSGPADAITVIITAVPGDVIRPAGLLQIIPWRDWLLMGILGAILLLIMVVLLVDRVRRRHERSLSSYIKLIGFLNRQGVSVKENPEDHALVLVKKSDPKNKLPLNDTKV